MRDYALRLEAATFDADRRVTNSDGAAMEVVRAQVALANSLGFADSYLGTYASMAIEAICDDDGRQEAQRQLVHRRARSPPPRNAGEVGRKAAERAVAKLGARKASTKVVPVVWEHTVARVLLRILGAGGSGEALYRRSTFLAELEGQQVGSPLLTLTDDPLLPGRLGSRPFDGEGVPVAHAAISSRPAFSATSSSTATTPAASAGATTGAANRGIASAPFARQQQLRHGRPAS